MGVGGGVSRGRSSVDADRQPDSQARRDTDGRPTLSYRAGDEPPPAKAKSGTFWGIASILLLATAIVIAALTIMTLFVSPAIR